MSNTFVTVFNYLCSMFYDEHVFNFIYIYFLSPSKFNYIHGLIIHVICKKINSKNICKNFNNGKIMYSYTYSKCKMLLNG